MSQLSITQANIETRYPLVLAESGHADDIELLQLPSGWWSFRFKGQESMIRKPHEWDIKRFVARLLLGRSAHGTIEKFMQRDKLGRLAEIESYFTHHTGLEGKAVVENSRLKVVCDETGEEYAVKFSDNPQRSVEQFKLIEEQEDDQRETD